MSIPCGRLTALYALIALFVVIHSLPKKALAIGTEEPIHFSGDKEVWSRKTGVVELFGHASVRQPGESLTADYIRLDQKSRTLDAHSNCVYVAPASVIFGDEMHFNLETRTGTVIGGRVSTDRFTLSGDRINKLGEGRYQTHWGEYTTCRDCSPSWTLRAKDVDMQIDGYAYMSDVSIKIKNASALWIPYLILPMKTRRQTGFLFPVYTVGSPNGLTFVEPFFWAINRSADMTIGLGTYTAKGFRGEWEGRYALSPRSGGTADLYFLNDASFESSVNNGNHQPYRYAVNVLQSQALPYHLEEKLKLTEVSDNFYPFSFNDLGINSEAYLASMASLSYTTSDLSADFEVRRYRNLLNFDPDVRKFDQATVQPMPAATVTAPDRYLFGSPIVAGLTANVTNFTRNDQFYDANAFPDPDTSGTSSFVPGKTPIREATRFSLSPSLYASISPSDGFALVPSLTYRGYFYQFPEAVHDQYGNLFRGYPLLQLDLSTEFERIYGMDNPDVPRRKHLVRPILTYSNIPSVQQDSKHPFVEQIQYVRNQALALSGTGGSGIGYNFDDNDIVPIETPIGAQNYFVPLGNSVSYGFTTQLIDKVQGGVGPSYAMPLEFSMGQTVNFKSFQGDHPGTDFPQPFSRVFGILSTNYINKFTTGWTYYYYPYAQGIRQELDSSITYVFERALHQQVLLYDRSFTFGYGWHEVGWNGQPNFTGTRTNTASGTLNFSISDYFLPQLTFQYDFINHLTQSWGINLQFQSPSQCWKITTGLNFIANQGHSFSPPSIALNLTGSGFEGVGEMAAGR